MELEARRFARRVVLIHLAILLALGLVLMWAAGALYRNAREQAIDQAKLTQELLTKQTALGIENYYEAVTGVVDLLQPAADQATTDTSELSDQPTTARTMIPRARTTPSRRGAQEGNPLYRVNNVLGNSIWFSIRDKASLLFILDPHDQMSVVRVIGAADDAPSPQLVIDTCRDFLASVHHRALSGFLRFSPQFGGDAHLVAVPLRNVNGLLIAALIPTARLERDVLASVNQSKSTGVMLIDESGVFVSATRRAAIGHKIDELNDPRTRELAEKHQAEKFTGTLVFDREEKLGDVTFKRGMATIQPLTVLGRSWALIISSDLAEIENFIKPVFRNVILWAGGVALAIAALLVSTAYQLISSRARLDRMQREVLTREIAEARRIQLHWLPKGNCRDRRLHIAALNRPATQISGDFYNWFTLEDGRFAVTIGDVTGHGMAAAFLMATTQLLVRNILPRVKDPGQCLKEVNAQLVNQSFNGQFVTLLILVIDPKHGTMEVATAGHPSPLVGNGDACKELTLEPQFVLGVEPTADYATEQFDLKRGQCIVLYTDGAVEAPRPDGERFNVERLTASVGESCDSAESIVASIDAALAEFRQGRDLEDDLTLVAVQLQPSAAY